VGANNPGAIAYLHPVIAGLVLLLMAWMLSMGLTQREQRTRKKAAPPGNLKRHSKLGPFVVSGYVFAWWVGLATAVTVRNMTPFMSWHSRLATLGGIGFVTVWLLGRKLLAGDKARANLHGVISVISLFAAGIAALLGISMLP
jgi:hypothetical protein